MKKRLLWFCAILALLYLIFGAQMAYAGEEATVIGQSVQGRNIIVYKLGDGPHKVLFIGGLHTGQEDNTRVLAERILAHFRANPGEIPAEVTLFILPSANPDGTANGTHENARGVDLNRNWPSANWSSTAYHPSSGYVPGLGGSAPLSEPETKSLWDFIVREHPKVAAVWHSKGSVVEANEAGAAPRFAKAYAAAAKYTYIEEWTAYQITGQFIDALEQKLGIPAFDIELSVYYSISGSEVARNIAGVRAVMREFAPKPVTPKPPPPTATKPPAPKPTTPPPKLSPSPTPIPPTATPVPPTATPSPTPSPTSSATPSPTSTPLPPTQTPTPLEPSYTNDMWRLGLASTALIAFAVIVVLAWRQRKRS